MSTAKGCVKYYFAIVAVYVFMNLSTFMKL